MIPVSDLLKDFQTMLRERWAYAWGSAKRGEVDCAGAFAWAYRQHGRSLYQGSNRMAREEVTGLIPIGEATLVPGMAAFKHRRPGEDGYDLPAAYRPGGSHHNGDLNDYYHVGLIDEDTSRVLNAQSAATGFVASAVGQGWSHVAYLRQVDYGQKSAEEEMVPMTTAEIYASNGKSVNLRASPSTSGARITQLRVGTTVEIIGYADATWAQVSAGSRTGYIMREYLRVDDGGVDASGGIEERLTSLEARVAALEGGHG